MDGNKKIKTLIYSVALVVSIVACSTKNTSYTGLYIDSETALKVSMETERVESGMTDKTQMKRNDSVISPQDRKNIIIISSDSAYSQKLIYENKSSLIRNQSQIKDSERSKKSEISKNASQAKDSIIKTSLKAQDKKLKEFQKQINEDDKSRYLPDSVFTLTKAQKLQIISGKSNTENDSINATKVNSEKDKIQKTDTVFVIREINKNVEKQDDSSQRKEDSKAENTGLKKRVERLESSQDDQEKREPIYIQNEAPAKQIERTSDQKVESTYREIVRYEPAQRQTNVQPTVVSNSKQVDTVYVEKEVPVRETIVLENRSEEAFYEKLNSQNDTIEQLKNRLTQKELLQRKTDTVYKINEVLVYKTKEVDSVSVTTFYEIGKIVPANNVLDELKEILQSRPVEKVMLSGYTDASGNQSINKALTDKRLDYLKEFVSKFVLLNKIYVQNFGDAFASSKIIPKERRVVITVYSKPNNEQSKIEK